jgi:argininosuccinate lyase
VAKKPWGGRFTQETNALTEAFTASISFDKRLYRYDITGSMAYCEVLTKAGIISTSEKGKILQALKEIEGEIEKGEFPFSTHLEDIHMHIEERLIAKIGETGGKLHTGRSRNDQIALDLRLYLKEEVTTIIDLIKKFQTSVVGVADKHMDVIMPGYTHLRKAQPILFAHHFMAYYEGAFDRCLGEDRCPPPRQRRPGRHPLSHRSGVPGKTVGSCRNQPEQYRCRE